MAGILRKVVRFYLYPVIRPTEIMGQAVKSSVAMLQESAGNFDQSDQSTLLTFDEVKANREKVAAAIEQRDLLRERSTRRLALLVMLAFSAIGLTGLVQFIAAIAARDLPHAESAASQFLVGLFVALISTLWRRSLYAPKKLLALTELLRQFLLIKRILIVLLMMAMGVLIVNIVFFKIMGSILSLASISLILSYIFRYALRIEQLRLGHAISAQAFYQKVGWALFFNLELSE